MTMKKLVSAILIAMLLTACACAETAFVTISNGLGELVMARQAIELSDTDSDGAITINDALFLAHESAYEGGAEAGYLAEDLGYGLSLSKLWGEENGGSYGYYLNNASAFNLTDGVADGDHVKAYVYTDLEAWSDTYCYFQADSAETAAGESVVLTLTALVFDADWNPVATPVEGAVITINGADSEFVTDANGAASVNLGEAGEYIISARSDSMTLVPPVCVLTVI